MAKKKPLPRNPQPKTSAGFPVAGIGASAGGLEAIGEFFSHMPEDSGIAFVLVSHLDPKHKSLLPELVQRKTKMEVRQAQEGSRVVPGTVFIIPPNRKLTIEGGRLHLTELGERHASHLPIDSFFRSLAADQGARSIGIVLSGTGSDGTLGLQAIKGELGMVMVQDEASAAYAGMPASAAGTGVADYILPPAQMPAKLVEYARGAFGRPPEKRAVMERKAPEFLKSVCAVIRKQTGHDFSLYKENTLLRRLERRMNVHHIEDISDYLHYLQDSPREVGILFQDLLIGVTNFFRDPKSFKSLQDGALKELVASKPDGYTFRVWVPGCATGEEAYSLAICLYEAAEARGRNFHIQVFGTDLDERAIDFARAGRYPGGIRADVSPERLERFFVRQDDGSYRIKKIIREMLVFAPQNLIKSPPFTKLDLLSCRNLLIYFGAELQQRLLPLFHYALKPDGLLFLGSSETVGQFTDLFAAVDKKWKIYARKAAAGTREGLRLVAGSEPPEPESKLPKSVRKIEELSVVQLVETILAQSETPPCAIVDDRGNAMYFHGRTGRFLEPAAGKARLNLLDMARPGLKAALSAVLRRAAASRREERVEHVRVEDEGREVSFDLRVRPILEDAVVRGLMMVIFEEHAPAADAASAPRRARGTAKTVEELQVEVQNTKECLQTSIEELETSNEELKSTNEELQSTNEELQSTNEELETSKEELQSLNEESETVNAELQSRIDELAKTADDLRNLLDSTDIATLFLDAEFRVRRFTPKTRELIPLSPGDCGRPIAHFASGLVDVDLVASGARVLEDLTPLEREVRARDGRSFYMRIKPYRTLNNAIDGVVCTFADVSEHREQERTLEYFFETIPDLLCVLTADKRFSRVNAAWEGLLGYAPPQLVGKEILEFVHPDDRITTRTHLKGIVVGDATPHFENRFRRKAGGYQKLSWTAVSVEDRKFGIARPVPESPDPASRRGGRG